MYDVHFSAFRLYLVSGFTPLGNTCEDLFRSGVNVTRVYSIDPDGDGEDIFEVIPFKYLRCITVVIFY